MLMVGAALFAYEPMRAQGTEPAIFGQDNNFVYPVWIVTELPVGLRGLILAGIFAAAISSLDSILAALSQTTLSLFRDERKQGREKRDLWISRLLVLVWGVLLSAFAVELDSLRGKVNVVVLAFGMISYTTGPMLGISLPPSSLLGQALGLTFGFFLSFALVAYLRPDFYQILMNFDLIHLEDALAWSGLEARDGKLTPLIHTAWAGRSPSSLLGASDCLFRQETNESSSPCSFSAT